MKETNKDPKKGPDVPPEANQTTIYPDKESLQFEGDASSVDGKASAEGGAKAAGNDQADDMFAPLDAKTDKATSPKDGEGATTNETADAEGLPPDQQYAQPIQVQEANRMQAEAGGTEPANEMPSETAGQETSRGVTVPPAVPQRDLNDRDQPVGPRIFEQGKSVLPEGAAPPQDPTGPAGPVQEPGSAAPVAATPEPVATEPEPEEAEVPEPAPVPEPEPEPEVTATGGPAEGGQAPPSGGPAAEPIAQPEGGQVPPAAGPVASPAAPAGVPVEEVVPPRAAEPAVEVPIEGSAESAAAPEPAAVPPSSKEPPPQPGLGPEDITIRSAPTSESADPPLPATDGTAQRVVEGPAVSDEAGAAAAEAERAKGNQQPL